MSTDPGERRVRARLFLCHDPRGGHLHRMPQTLGLTSDGLAVCSYRPCGEFGRSVDLQLSLDLEEASSAYMDYEDARARLRGAV
jgi:hypothetical protein